MEYPKFAKVNDKKYKINTSFRIAIECDNIARDDTIGDYERALAIIYKLYSEEGLNNPNDYEKLLEIAKKYLSCGDKLEDSSNKEPDMDFNQDMGYIETSFLSDFGIDLEKQDLHWWKFMEHMNGLSNSEMGNCCILNRIRNLRNYDTSKIKDEKTKREIEEQKRKVALKKKNVIQKEFNDNQKENIDNFMASLRKE